MRLETRNHLDTIFRAALQRVEPSRMILDHVRLAGDRLLVRFENEHHEIDLAPFKRIFVLGTGKATAPMAQALETILGERIDTGLIVVKYNHTAPLKYIKTLEAGHPVPDGNGVAGAAAISLLAKEADEQTLVITLISGGGSALLPSPLNYRHNGETHRLSLADKQETTRALLRCGADITEINCIRKHLSSLKGGRLLQRIAPARSVNFILSDVVGDDLSSIASGLTSPDITTYADAMKILAAYGIEQEIPATVLEALQAGARGEIQETLKPGSEAEKLSTNILIGTNAKAMTAAGEMAKSLGYNVAPLTSRITAEARDVAKVLAGVAVDVAGSELLVRKPACVISGGEPVVTLQGNGKGGRNQEMALAFLAEIERHPGGFNGVSFLAASTDGNDGPTDAAGAFASLEILQQAKEAGLSIQDALRANDSYTFYDSINELYKTGPTNTNVCDLHVILVE